MAEGRTGRAANFYAPGDLIDAAKAWCDRAGTDLSKAVRVFLGAFTRLGVQVWAALQRTAAVEGVDADVVLGRWVLEGYQREGAGHDAAQLGQLKVFPAANQEDDVPDEEARKQIAELKASQDELRGEVEGLKGGQDKILEKLDEFGKLIESAKRGGSALAHGQRDRKRTK